MNTANCPFLDIQIKALKRFNFDNIHEKSEAVLIVLEIYLISIETGLEVVCFSY